MLDITTSSSSDHHLRRNDVTTTTTTTKRKRRPAGTPDPEAEVVSLSAKTLLESDRYVCEICGQGFQRDQNLQMHRRRHKVPWKLLKRDSGDVVGMKKRVFVCPEESCLHHDPSHALGDLVGIKKHFRRKHSAVKHWACTRCSKAYAVQSDFKAHLKTCGTRGHSCDCGRVFSRVESFIEHQDSCTVRSIVILPEVNTIPFSGGNNGASTASSTSPSSDANFRHRKNNTNYSLPPTPIHDLSKPRDEQDQCQCLQLLPPSSSSAAAMNEDDHPPIESFFLSSSTRLKLSIGSSSSSSSSSSSEEEKEKFSSAMAEEARREAKREIAMAEAEFGNAKRIRRQAQSELEKARLLREQARKRISSTLLQITCQACKRVEFQDSLVAGDETTSLAMSYSDQEEGEQ